MYDPNMRRMCTIAILYRILNCTLIQTWFEPDEYYQALEPAHNMAFGYGYLTWEWRRGLRSYIYPLLIAILYRTLSLFSLDSRTWMIITPALFHSIVSAFADMCYYKTVRLLFDDFTAVLSLATYWLNWFQFFCSPRTLSNSIESQLLLVGLYFFDWPLKFVKNAHAYQWKSSITLYVPIAVVSTIIRPTAAVLWAPLILWNFSYVANKLHFAVKFVSMGVTILVLSIIIDRFCYGYWVFSMLNFFLFNFASSGSAHFGTHPWHWFISNGLPTILFMHTLPITLGIFKSNVRWILYLSFFYCFIHSLIPHKELRFLLPILPLLNIYCALYLQSSSFASSQVKNCRKFSIYYSITSTKAKAVMYLLLFTNLPLMIYTGIVHQRGVLDVVSYLGDLATTKSRNSTVENGFSALILAPCHTTPLFSHIHANISVRFLACEPNFDNLVDYVDEADRFYADPRKWLDHEWEAKTFRPPSHVIMFESLWKKLNNWFADKKYRRCAKFFNAHFPVSSRQSRYLLVICR